jgi:hypothetical protein
MRAPGGGICILTKAASARFVRKEEVFKALRTAFDSFRATRWFRVVYLILLGVIVAQLYLFTRSALQCVILLLIPITVFILPYWMGERKARRFAVNGAVVFTIALVTVAAMSTQVVLAQSEPLFELQSFAGRGAAPGVSLTNGTVSPYQGSPGQTFTFRVNLTTAWNSTPDQFDVYLNLTTVDGLSISEAAHPMTYSPGPGSSSNPRNGSWYEGNLTVGGSVYLFRFSVTGGRNWTSTFQDLGPITASGLTLYGFWIYYESVLTGGLPVEFLLYLGILFLWWYMIRTREAARRRGMRPPEPAKESTPSDAATPKGEGKTEGKTEGKAAKAAAFTCTNCGADVGESDVKCPKCGAAFEE